MFNRLSAVGTISPGLSLVNLTLNYHVKASLMEHVVPIASEFNYNLSVSELF